MSYYQKSGLTLPYLIDTDVERWYQDGQEKIKYTQKWAVLGKDANDFVSNIDRSYNNKNLASTSREDRGALTIITATYGETYWGDGECEWYTVSGGLYTHHISKWVNNTASAIKSFCAYALGKAIYRDGVSVSCNPVSGEPYVLCEASWTEERDEEEGEGEDPGSGGGSGGDGEDGEDEEEQEPQSETGKSVQFSSTVESRQIDIETVKKHHPYFVKYQDGMEVVSRWDAGEIVWLTKDSNTMISTDGWYEKTNNVIAFKNGPLSYNAELKPEIVAEMKAILTNPPTFDFPVIRCTVNSKIESADKMSIESMVGDMGNVGEKSSSIGAGGSSISAPQLVPLNLQDGGPYTFKTEWMFEGSSFDQTQISVKNNPLTAKSSFVGEISKSYRTYTTIG